MLGHSDGLLIGIGAYGSEGGGGSADGGSADGGNALTHSDSIRDLANTVVSRGHSR